jgi:integrase/recombinase XerD
MTADLPAIIAAADGELAEPDAVAAFTEEWLRNRRFAANTREAYRRDVGQWVAWCAEHGLDPLRAKFIDVNVWARELEEPAGPGRRGLAPTSVVRKMSAVSSWYGFLVRLGALAANPAAVSDRPPVDRDFSPTVSFTRDEAVRMLQAAAEGDRYLGPAAPALAAWLVEMGTRATETTRIDVADLGHSQGFRVVQLTLKGGRRQNRTLPPPLAALLDEYLQARAEQSGCSVQELTGPLFVDRRGEPLDRHDLYRFVRRLAKRAELPNATKITPHGFRHAWNSMARAAGATLEDRQDAMGHRDPRTTRRYDRAGRSLMHDPALLVAAAVAVRPEHDPGQPAGTATPGGGS